MKMYNENNKQVWIYDFRLIYQLKIKKNEIV